MIKIRALRREEFIDLMKLIQRIFPERGNCNIFMDIYEIFPEGFVVAIEDEKLIGFAIGIMSDDYTGRILLIGVDEKYRRMGIGTRLLRKLNQILVSYGARKIQLEVRVSNEGAMKFYQRNGFIKINRIKSFYEDGEDGYVMIKNL